MITLATVPVQRHRGLTVFPLLRPDGPWGGDEGELRYLLLSEAFRTGHVSVEEVGQGTVPWLQVRNGGKEGVLILDGEQLLGGKQNRMVNRSILVPGKAEVRIPVSCMEQGRWSGGHRPMTGTGLHSPSSVRRKARDVEAGRASAGHDVSSDYLQEAQGAVWQKISELSHSFETRSHTGDLDQVYRSRRDLVEDRLSHFPPVAGQVGILAFWQGTPLGMDELGSQTLWSRVHGRILRGYMLDAMDLEADRGRPAPEAEAVPRAEEARAFLGKVESADRTEAPSVGAGRYQVLSGAVVGGELHDGEPLIHRSAFPVEERGRRSEDYPTRPMAPPSRRRRGYRPDRES
jgi:hypothetical protein